MCGGAGREAGDTYSKLADVHIKQDGKTDAAQAYVEAAKAYQRVDKSSECIVTSALACALASTLASASISTLAWRYTTH